MKKPNASRLVALAAELTQAQFVDAVWNWRDSEFRASERKRRMAMSDPLSVNVARLQDRTAAPPPERKSLHPCVRAIAGGKQ